MPIRETNMGWKIFASSEELIRDRPNAWSGIPNAVQGQNHVKQLLIIHCPRNSYFFPVWSFSFCSCYISSQSFTWTSALKVTYIHNGSRCLSILIFAASDWALRVQEQDLAGWAEPRGLVQGCDVRSAGEGGASVLARAEHSTKDLADRPRGSWVLQAFLDERGPRTGFLQVARGTEALNYANRPRNKGWTSSYSFIDIKIDLARLPLFSMSRFGRRMISWGAVLTLWTLLAFSCSSVSTVKISSEMHQTTLGFYCSFFLIRHCRCVSPINWRTMYSSSWFSRQSRGKCSYILTNEGIASVTRYGHQTSVWVCFLRSVRRSTPATTSQGLSKLTCRRLRIPTRHSWPPMGMVATGRGDKWLPLRQ